MRLDMDMSLDSRGERLLSREMHRKISDACYAAFDRLGDERIKIERFRVPFCKAEIGDPAEPWIVVKFQHLSGKPCNFSMRWREITTQSASDSADDIGEYIHDRVRELMSSSIADLAKVAPRRELTFAHESILA